MTSALNSQGDPGEDVQSLFASIFPSTKWMDGALQTGGHDYAYHIAIFMT